jgi:sulfate adenylyltransferase subunit 2
LITPPNSLSNLEKLESESIHILREVVAECKNPVLLYSIGKDSAVLLRLAQKAFYPEKIPFPVLHIDTTWKFKEMIVFRDQIAGELGLDLIVHTNQVGLDQKISPFSHDPTIYTNVMKTEALKQAMDKYCFDAAFGGARRDEEKSRSKERVFSFRTRTHRWDPKNQRPEMWSLFNGRLQKGESVRVFPLSNWTEADIWQYIYQDGIPIVSLYLAADRPVVDRDGTLIMVDDDRMLLQPSETLQIKRVRFRTLGCYPLTGAIESDATNLLGVVRETVLSNTSERNGRIIDYDSNCSMEKKKLDGYF